MYEYRQVLSRMRLGGSDREIAASRLMGRGKIARVRAAGRARGWLDPGRGLPTDAELAAVFARRAVGAVVASACEPYRTEVTRWAKQDIDATTIHSALVRRHGYAGSYSSVQRFVRSLGLTAKPASSPMSFSPGEAAQVDFGAGPEIVDVFTGEVIKTWVFVMTLAWSRHWYLELVTDQSVMTWLSAHSRAFVHFGGVPERVIIDNPKCAITKACYHDPVVQRTYGEFAEDFGFLIAPCPPRDPQKKGRVESSVKYVKRSFFPLREFRSLADANTQLGAWGLEVGSRVHGSTREQPLQRFAEIERGLLKPLPGRLPEPCEWAQVKVHGDCHVQYKKAKYSAPYKRVRETLWLKATAATVGLYQGDELICTHPRAQRPGDRSTIAEHMPPRAVAYKMRDPQWCLTQASRVGICTRTVIERLFDHKVTDNLRAAQGIVGTLLKSYGPARLEAACERGLSYDEIHYRTIKTILDRGLDQIPIEPVATVVSGAYDGSGRFCRDMTTLFDPNPTTKETP